MKEKIPLDKLNKAEEDKKRALEMDGQLRLKKEIKEKGIDKLRDELLIKGFHEQFKSDMFEEYLKDEKNRESFKKALREKTSELGENIVRNQQDIALSILAP